MTAYYSDILEAWLDSEVDFDTQQDESNYYGIHEDYEAFRLSELRWITNRDSWNKRFFPGTKIKHEKLERRRTKKGCF